MKTYNNNSIILHSTKSKVFYRLNLKLCYESYTKSGVKFDWIDTQIFCSNLDKNQISKLDPSLFNLVQSKFNIVKDYT